MKLNDLVRKYFDKASDYAKDCDNQCGIDKRFNLTINGEKFFNIYYAPDEFEPVYYRSEDVTGEPHRTTLSKYDKYVVKDYSVEVIVEKGSKYRCTCVSFFLEIEMEKPKKCPTLEEVIRRYDLDKKRAENEYEYALGLVVDGKRIANGFDPRFLFKYRDYEVKRMYTSTSQFYDNEFRVGRRYILFLKK